MRWKPRLLNLGSDGRDDNGGAVFVADIVLDNQNGPESPLFRTENRVQIGKVDFTPGRLQSSFPPSGI